MHKACPNIYKKARENANLTRVQASLKLNVSDSTLKTYETGVTIPNDAVVLEMTKIYNNKILGHIHLRKNSPLAAEILEEITEENLSTCMLKLLKELNDVELIKSDMISITCDGMIDIEEKHTWNKSLKELRDVMAVITTLMLIT